MTFTIGALLPFSFKNESFTYFSHSDMMKELDFCLHLWTTVPRQPIHEHAPSIRMNPAQRANEFSWFGAMDDFIKLVSLQLSIFSMYDITLQLYIHGLFSAPHEGKCKILVVEDNLFNLNHQMKFSEKCINIEWFPRNSLFMEYSDFNKCTWLEPEIKQSHSL